MKKDYVHGYSPRESERVQVWKCLIKAQQDLKCDPLIGRRVHPLLQDVGFRNIHISPRVVYVDSSKPELVEGFIKNTIIAMVEGVKEQALEQNMTAGNLE